jgi:hypothetical protein
VFQRPPSLPLTHEFIVFKVGNSVIRGNGLHLGECKTKTSTAKKYRSGGDLLPAAGKKNMGIISKACLS